MKTCRTHLFAAVVAAALALVALPAASFADEAITRVDLTGITSDISNNHPFPFTCSLIGEAAGQAKIKYEAWYDGDIYFDSSDYSFDSRRPAAGTTYSHVITLKALDGYYFDGENLEVYYDGELAEDAEAFVFADYDMETEEYIDDINLQISNLVEPVTATDDIGDKGKAIERFDVFDSAFSYEQGDVPTFKATVEADGPYKIDYEAWALVNGDGLGEILYSDNRYNEEILSYNIEGLSLIDTFVEGGTYLYNISLKLAPAAWDADEPWLFPDPEGGFVPELYIDGELATYQEAQVLNGQIRYNGVKMMVPGFGASRVFPDVTDGYWYTAVYAMAGSGIMKGYESGADAGTFGEGKNMKREEFLTLLYRYVHPFNTDTTVAADYAKKDPSVRFADVKDNQYYTAAINWAVSLGITTNQAKFNVGQPIGFEEMVTFMYRTFSTDVLVDMTKLYNSSIIDGSKVGIWHQPAMAWALQTGLVSGYEIKSGKNAGKYELRPAEKVKRERAATVFYKGINAGILSVG